MRSALLAEKLLARYTTAASAASIVGDLVEDGNNRGSIGFCLSFCTILWSFVWRRTLAFVLALIFGFLSFDFLHNLMYGVHAAYLPSNQWRILLDFVCLASILLSFGMAYTVVRYGVKNGFTQQVIVLWGLTSIVSAYWWMPVVAVAVALLGASFLLASFLSLARRQALFASVIALSFAVGVYLLASFVMHNLAGSHLRVFNNLAFSVFTLGLVLQPTVYSRVHTWSLAGLPNSRG